MVNAVVERSITGQTNSQFRSDRPVPENLVTQPPAPDIRFSPHTLDSPAVRERILNNGADPEDVAKVFDEDGLWIYKGHTGDYPTLWTTSPALVTRAVVEMARPVYDLVDYNLRGQKWPHGFNRHNLEHHVLRVFGQADSLLDDAGYRSDQPIKRINNVAAIAHDLGNVIERGEHADRSVDILLTILPDVLQDPKLAEVVIEAVRYHDEKKLATLIGSWENKTEEDDIYMLRALGPVLMAIFLGDKLGDAIGRHRVNPWSRTTEGINGDTHMWPNYLAAGTELELSRYKNELKSVVEFNPTISPTEYDEFVEVAEERSDHEGYRAVVPDVIQQIYQDHQIPHFLLWAGNLIGINRKRIELSALCAKALYPGLEKFTFELRDRAGRRGRGGGRVVEEIYFDGNLREQFDYLALKYTDKERSSNGEYQQSRLVFDATSTQH